MNEQVRKYIDKYSNEIIDMYDILRKLIFDSASSEPQETMIARCKCKHKRQNSRDKMHCSHIISL